MKEWKNVLLLGAVALGIAGCDRPSGVGWFSPGRDKNGCSWVSAFALPPSEPDKNRTVTIESWQDPSKIPSIVKIFDVSKYPLVFATVCAKPEEQVVLFASSGGMNGSTQVVSSSQK